MQNSSSLILVITFMVIWTRTKFYHAEANQLLIKIYWDSCMYFLFNCCECHSYPHLPLRVLMRRRVLVNAALTIVIYKRAPGPLAAMSSRFVAIIWIINMTSHQVLMNIQHWDCSIQPRIKSDDTLTQGAW